MLKPRKTQLRTRSQRTRTLQAQSRVAFQASSERTRRILNDRFANTEGLVRFRQTQRERINGVNQAYVNSTQNVLNKQTLDFLIQQSNIDVPTLTSIFAGFELARASRADRENLRRQSTIDNINGETEIAAQRSAITEANLVAEQRELDNQLQQNRLENSAIQTAENADVSFEERQLLQQQSSEQRRNRRSNVSNTDFFNSLPTNSTIVNGSRNDPIGNLLPSQQNAIDNSFEQEENATDLDLQISESQSRLDVLNSQVAELEGSQSVNVGTESNPNLDDDGVPLPPLVDPNPGFDADGVPLAPIDLTEQPVTVAPPVIENGEPITSSLIGEVFDSEGFGLDSLRQRSNDLDNVIGDLSSSNAEIDDARRLRDEFNISGVISGLDDGNLILYQNSETGQQTILPRGQQVPQGFDPVGAV